MYIPIYILIIVLGSLAIPLLWFVISLIMWVVYKIADYRYNKKCELYEKAYGEENDEEEN